ncbi:MAG TPA: GNAT family N-acetyltransferase [Acidimicrobiales bacterium]|nr:GNAT family N-acetyltransferase [Acidimicrobiales bacterium]
MDRQPTLEGTLVRVRPLEPEDFEPLYAIASDPLLWDQHPAKERAERSGFELWFEDATASGGALVVIDRRDDQIIGSSRYAGYDPERRQVEIGWTFLARSHWGGPYNAELKSLMLRHAFQFVDAVMIRVHSGNLRSQRAVEKLGARRVAIEPDVARGGENYVFRLEAPAGP